VNVGQPQSSTRWPARILLLVNLMLALFPPIYLACTSVSMAVSVAYFLGLGVVVAASTVALSALQKRRG
jgi:hypothetical protein